VGFSPWRDDARTSPCDDRGMQIGDWQIEFTPDGSEVVGVRNDAAGFDGTTTFEWQRMADLINADLRAGRIVRDRGQWTVATDLTDSDGRPYRESYLSGAWTIAVRHRDDDAAAWQAYLADPPEEWRKVIDRHPTVHP
jgi:hypothetical protein